VQTLKKSAFFQKKGLLPFAPNKNTRKQKKNRFLANFNFYVCFLGDALGIRRTFVRLSCQDHAFCI